jgi:hypothetical protein
MRFKPYSVIAQIDNRPNAKMAASSSRESTAMKTLAFITTLFLSGTFVAVSLPQELALSCDNCPRALLTRYLIDFIQYEYV